MKWIACIVFLFALNAGIAQRISHADMATLKTKEDSLRSPSFKLIQGINASDRLQADSVFTKILVRALKINNSFYYPFDSLITISTLYPTDSTFRIFTWQMIINDNVIRQHGAIQMKTTDGSLKLFPLIDKSDITENMADTIGSNFGWMGALYYKIITTSFNGNFYYTLLGFDENNIRSNKKVIEVLHFENDKPVFGGHYFSFPPKHPYSNDISRYIYEFKKESGPRLTYDNQLQMIVMEHLVSESNEPNKLWTLVGDGDYEGFKWVGGKWVYNSKIFNEVTPEGQAPIPNMILDEKGKVIDSNLKKN